MRIFTFLSFCLLYTCFMAYRVAAQCQPVPTVNTPPNLAAIPCQSNDISNNQNINNGDLGFLNGTNINDLKINNGGTAVFCNNANVQNNLDMNGASRLHINGTSTLPNGGSFSNQAVIIVQNGGTLNSSRSNYNGATIVVRSGGTLNLNANFENATIIIESGGTVNLNVSAFNQNVTLVVNSGATLNINNNLDLNQNSQIINYGIVNTTRNITLQGNPSRIFNATNAARFNMGNLTINNGGRLVNYGGVSANNLTINGGDSGQSICMAANSAISVERITANNLTNSVQVPSGTACFRIRGTASNQLNNVLTGTSNLTVCTPTGMAASTGGAAAINNGFGAATIAPNCNDDMLCNSILPLTWVSFHAKVSEQNCVDLEWVTAEEINNSHFEILRSIDGMWFETIGTVEGHGNSRSLQIYRFTDCESRSTVTYYQIRQTDFDGAVSYSRIISVGVAQQAAWKSALTEGGLEISTPHPIARLAIHLFDLSGRILYRYESEMPPGNHFIPLPALGMGMYLVHVDSVEMSFTHKFFIVP